MSAPIDPAAAGVRRDSLGGGAAMLALSGSGGRRSRRVRHVPNSIVVLGSWSWRVVFIAVALYIAVRILKMLALLVLAVIAAVLFTAFLRPVTRRLRRFLPPVVSSLLTLALGAVVLAGFGYFIVLRATIGMPALLDQFSTTVQQLTVKLHHLVKESAQLDQLANTATDWLQRHRSSAVDIVTTSASYAIEVVTGVLLAAFITFFLLYDGERIWRWLLQFFAEPLQERCDRAGRAAWMVITGYVRGTVAIATIHGVVIGIVLVLLGTPLAAPLAMLVFLGSFVPLIGALVAGGLAVLVTFGAGGWVPAVILTAVLVLENQLEAHVFQPLIMGHSVRLHPLAIGLSVTAGTLVGGIVGALVAVPFTAIVYRSAPLLVGRGDRTEPGGTTAGGNDNEQ